MRNSQSIAIARLLTCLPRSLELQIPAASSFSRQTSGAGRRGPVAGATFADQIYFEFVAILYRFNQAEMRQAPAVCRRARWQGHHKQPA